MSPGLEPVFAPGRPVWPLAGMGSGGFEPDDPNLVIPAGILEHTARDLPEKLLPSELDGGIGAAPTEPMRLPPVAVRGWSTKWRLALAASCLLHATAALFIMTTHNEAMLIEGTELSGVAFHGNAPEDQLSKGEIAGTSDATVDVTIITMLEARPLDTVVAEVMPAEENAEPIKVVEVGTTAVHPVKTAAARSVKTDNAEPVDGAVATVAAVVSADRAESVETTAQPPASSAEPVPEILATDRLETIEDDNLVQKSLEPVEAVETAVQETVESSTPERVEPVAAAKVETGEADRAAPSAETTAEAIDTSKTEHVEPARVELIETEVSETSEILEDVASPPLPESRPELVDLEPAPQKPATRPKEVKKGKTASKAKKAGNGGSNQADARRGQADGREAGQAASKSKGGSTSATGNAAVSNYPGKVASKLRKALRYPAAAKRQRLRGQVRVSFVVSASGSVSSIRVVSSSGSPVLDKAALETVHRAAPFPAIPRGAGRSSWPFTVPLAFSR